MVSAIVWPKLPVVGKMLPGPFVAIVVSISFSAATSAWFPAKTLEHVAGASTFAGGLRSLPSWNFPPAGVDWTSHYMWGKVIITGVRMAIVGLVESLLTLMLVDQITETKGSTTREAFGQSLGNITSGLFGVQGGCALIGQTLINVGGGGKGRLSGVVMATGMLLTVVVLGPIIGKIPVASLVGLMFVVALNTFAWGSLELLTRSLIHWTDGAVIVLVTLVTVFHDLASAVILGLVCCALVFAWNASKRVKLEQHANEATDTRTFHLHGQLFFGSAMSYQSQIEVGRIPEGTVILDFTYSSVLDHSGVDAIVKIIERLTTSGKQVFTKGLPEHAKAYVEAMGHAGTCTAGDDTKKTEVLASGRTIKGG
eukprot:gnl/TRDRNA2_/TRDRNA2_107967_c3_seq1.p1 gnl/TRDRNA2_/TRDRNA2_107967_c3~~gnl/TRDRNA2_/TRDRNA2_107967_c3_seq1.p1  ORF type:complete len:368 (-),score=55.95 gnl/TRDRNA2_/TRDRNA2_107967_c3_seq1:88-1191(-)